MDRSSKQNINKHIATLNNALDQMDLTSIYIEPKSEIQSFSDTHGTFSKIDHMIRSKTSFKKLRKSEIISSIFSDHKDLILETNLKKKI